jgi:hypothetical protein
VGGLSFNRIVREENSFVKFKGGKSDMGSYISFVIQLVPSGLLLNCCLGLMLQA